MTLALDKTCFTSHTGFVEETLQPEQPSPPNPPVHPQISPVIFVVAGVIVVLTVVAGMFYYLFTKKSASQSTNMSVTPVPTTAVSGDSQAQEVEPAGGSMAESEVTTKTDVLDIHGLPLGDGKVSTTPKTGYVYSCTTEFRGGGAQHTGSWIHGNTWDLSEKIAVQGVVTWPTAQFTLATSGQNRIITGNGLPLDTKTGTFPIAQNDPAYQIDRNPNAIVQQDISLSLPMDPKFAATPSCVPMGMVGVALNGVAIYNALDDAGRDAVAHETQDLCDGHPQGAGEYHYHGPSECLPDQQKNNTLIGYAIDGFGIYSMYDAQGKEMTNADLDACHGTTSTVLWEGKEVSMYHYVLTREYPYTIGCFKGNPARVAKKDETLFQRLPPPR